mmetsp:Transcript_38186/g.65482  ORF Transcript_38186/g.65482 Transcript_38186/m.65482 type:complete len:106 (+) Transcript_38186:383-700(+)
MRTRSESHRVVSPLMRTLVPLHVAVGRVVGRRGGRARYDWASGWVLRLSEMESWASHGDRSWMFESETAHRCAHCGVRRTRVDNRHKQTSRHERGAATLGPKTRA